MWGEEVEEVLGGERLLYVRVVISDTDEVGVMGKS